MADTAIAEPERMERRIFLAIFLKAILVSFIAIGGTSYWCLRHEGISIFKAFLVGIQATSMESMIPEKNATIMDLKLQVPRRTF
jgi:hypothetical protein